MWQDTSNKHRQHNTHNKNTPTANTTEQQQTTKQHTATQHMKHKSCNKKHRTSTDIKTHITKTQTQHNTTTTNN